MAIGELKDIGGLELTDWWAIAPTTPVTPARSADKQRFHQPERRKLSASKIPDILSVRYYEPQRDYQSGIQTSSRSGHGRSVKEIELPAAINSAGAKRLADLQLLQSQRTRSHWTAHVVINENQLHCGDWIEGETDGGRWRITTSST